MLCVYGVNLTASIVDDKILVALTVMPYYFFTVYGTRIAEYFLLIFSVKRKAYNFFFKFHSKNFSNKMKVIDLEKQLSSL